MAANDEFPRGWLLSNAQLQSGTAANCQVPAAPGISHVLTAINAELYSFTGAAAFSPNVTITSPNTLGGVPVQYLLNNPPPAGSDAISQWSWTGKIAIPAGLALIVAFNAVASNGYIELLEIQGYDI